MYFPAFIFKIYELYGQTTKAYKSVLKLHSFYYKKLEAYILADEEMERYRIKKSILLYYTYLMIICYLAMPYVNPEASKIKSMINVASAFCQIFILKSKNYHLIGSYGYLQSILSVVLEYFTGGDPLTMIILVLANQHMFFLFPENEILGKIYIPCMILLIRQMQMQLKTDFDAWNPKLETSINSLINAWPALFLFHHYGAKNLTTSYRVALIGNMEIQKELKNTLCLLEKTNRELKDAVVARELFIASVSHELRNPLNCMIGNIELVALDTTDPKLLKMLDTCKICGEVLLGQINNVLDVAKINAEKLELHYLPGSFHGLIEKVWRILSIPIKQKNLRGELRISRNFPKFIEMDSHRLTQIFLNLIGNASKFTQSGSISVQITWHQGETMNEFRKPSKQYLDNLNKKKQKSKVGSINLSEHRQSRYSLETLDKNDSDSEDLIEITDDEKAHSVDAILKRELKPKGLCHVRTEFSSYIFSSVDEDIQLEDKVDSNVVYGNNRDGIMKIEVTDTGCGMSPDAIKNLFQAFRQADSSITRQYGGTGLGLYISKQVITKMKGEITCYSEEGVGSSFVILLPAKIATKSDVNDENKSLNTEQEDTGDTSIMRALVVDDIAGNQQVLVNYLKKLNIQSETADNGLEALNKVKAKGLKYYSFITMDLQMPVMDGLTSAKAIREHERKLDATKDIPIIVITGNCAETEKTRCLDPIGEIRAYNFFRKPFTFDECKTIVNAIQQDALAATTQRQSRVLVVEGDTFNKPLSKEHLIKSGYSCISCFSSREAINLITKDKYDIVLLDCDMLGMDDYSTARKIKQIQPTTAIIGMTGKRREECLGQCLENGMYDVEMKPLDFKRVVNTIDRLINGRINPNSNPNSKIFIK